MPIKIKRIPISLTPSQPTELTAENLQSQLKTVGLTCPEAELKALQGHIKDITSGLANGESFMFATYAPVSRQTKAMGVEEAPQVTVSAFDGSSSETYQLLKDVQGTWQPKNQSGLDAQGNWEPKDAGYAKELKHIIYPKNFDELMKDSGFKTRGHTSKDEKHEKYDSVDAVKIMFKDLAVKISQEVFGGLKKDDLEAIFTNILGPLDDQSAKDYDKSDSRSICWAKDYDPEKETVEKLGVLNICWHLKIKDYKNKDKDALKHDTELTMTSRAVEYDDLDVLMADYKKAGGE